ncbi:MAG: nuclear transport factor 2 family protein [Chloroflexi bacterium]|nr:nuclear transport factor 2 family protein [Chloroflexota bacterium]MCC6892339.1 nuclear transport factor 2 family protein [Anaerolineae bacterium]
MTDNNTADAVIAVVAAETNAFWLKDYAAWADCWLHSEQIRMVGWWARGGISITIGWNALSAKMQQMMADNPTAQPEAAAVRRENINIRTSDQMAWVTFDQYGADTGEPDMDMPGLSHETRILEKHDGQWKFVYVGWLLAGE